MESVHLRIGDTTLRAHLFTGANGEVSIQIPLREVTSNGGIVVCAGEHAPPKAPPPTLPPRGSSSAANGSDASDSEFSVVGSVGGNRNSYEQVPSEAIGQVTKDDQTRILAATTAQTLHALCPVFIAIDESKLDAIGDWTSRARLARAFRAGVSVRWQRRDRRCCLVDSPPIEARRSPVCYVILKCQRYAAPIWVSTLRKYREILLQGDRTLEPHSISHSFLSVLEGSVYLEAAGFSWADTEQVL